jgi:hypothetical protein
MSQNLTLKPKGVNSVLESVCHQCRKLRSRRFAHVAQVRGRTVFICQSCCETLNYDGHGLEFFLTEFGPRGGAA